MENFHQQHAKEVLEVLDRLVRKEEIQYIVFAGDQVVSGDRETVWYANTPLGSDGATITRHGGSLVRVRPDGTGLGLPLALKWLNAQGADLRLASRPEGGTCAEIRW